MKILRRRNLLLAAIIAFLVIYYGRVCTVCRSYAGMHGALLDSRDGKPIQGAAVVGVFYVEHGTVGGTLDEPVDATETTTDAEGRFTLPGKLVWAPRFPSLGKPTSQFSKQPRLHIFAPNYESVCVWSQQAYSSVDSTNIPLGTNASGLSIYRTEARPIITVVTTKLGKVYEFRLSHLETETQRAYHANTDFVNGPACKFPNYLKLFNTERVKYGLPEWHGWDK